MRTIEHMNGVVVVMRVGKFIAVLAVLSLALAALGCGSSGGSGGKIEGVNWKLESYMIAGGTRAVPSSVTVTALFEEGRVSGESGVNTYRGEYKLSGASLRISNVATTLMAGPPEAMEVEQEFVSLLERTRTFTAEGTGLKMFDDAGAEILVFAEGNDD